MVRKLTYELCKEVISKYETYTELYKNDVSIIMKVKQKKWNELLSHFGPIYSITNPKWTYEKCKEETLKLTHYSDLQGTTLYNVLKQNKWIDELTTHLIRQQRKPYTYEELQQEALKYKTRIDFQKNSNAYCAASKRGILDDICSHMGKSQNERRYTKEEILESAKKYTNQRDWHQNEPSIFRCAAGFNKKHKSEEDKQFWLSCIEHMDFIFKPNGWWTFDRCKEEALKYFTYKEFRKKSHAYRVIIKNGWWDELCGHITSNRKRNGHWTYETCKETALKYTDREELSKNEGSCYRVIMSNGWNELLSHIEYKTTLFHRYIYAFEFSDNHVYVGLTHNLNKRKSDHLTSNKTISPVREHIKKTGLNFTFKNIFDEPFPKEIAGEMEGKVLNDYISNGWIPLNRKKTGGLGGSQVIWTYDKIKKDLEGIRTLSDAKKKLPSWVFSVIKKFGWDDLLSTLLIDVRVLWTIETATEELKKYSRRCDIQENQNGLYKFASKNNLLHLVPKSKPVRKNPLKDKYSKEEVYERCLSYGTGEEIKQNDREYYTCAKNNGWWEDIVELLKNKRGIKSKYSYEDCLNIALKYETKNELTKDWSGVVKTIKKNGWWEVMTKHMKRKINEQYTVEEVVQICKNYRNRSELEKQKPGVFKFVQKHNLMEELFPRTMMKPKHWTKENCLIESLKYTSRKDFMNGSSGAYSSARSNGWLDEICSHMYKRELNDEEKRNRDLKITQKLKEGYTYKEIKSMFKVHQRVIKKLRDSINNKETKQLSLF